MKKVDWAGATMELCRKVAKYEFLAEKNKNILTYIPNGVETTEIAVKAAAIYTDITDRYNMGG